MGKFGWSYPPGVTESMLPGNTPEDQAYEKLCEELGEILGELTIPEETFDKLTKYMGEAYIKGYQQGQSDEAMAHDKTDGEE